MAASPPEAGLGRLDVIPAPVEITPHAPPAHPEACGLWGWCELKYADGFTLVIESGEWGDKYDRLEPKNLKAEE